MSKAGKERMVLGGERMLARRSLETGRQGENRTSFDREGQRAAKRHSTSEISLLRGRTEHGREAEVGTQLST